MTRLDVRIGGAPETPDRFEDGNACLAGGKALMAPIDHSRKS
jgi:hypothetical protein